MMKKIICSIGLIVAACSVAVICSSCGKKEERGELKRIWYNGSYNRDFKDLNDVHLAEAKRIGIKPASNREEAEKVKKEMEEIETNEYYEVEKLTHSIPYLIPVLLHPGYSDVLYLQPATDRMLHPVLPLQLIHTLHSHFPTSH